MAEPPTATIYWPLGIVGAPRGFLVGWNLHSFHACISAVVSGVELHTLELALSKLASDPSLSSIHKHSRAPPVVLGEWESGPSPAVRPTQHTVSHGILGVPSTASLGHGVARARSEASLWLTLRASSDGRPILREVICCGYKYNAYAHVIFYRAPRSLRFLSSVPLPLSQAFSDYEAPIHPLSDMENTIHQINCVPIIRNSLHRFLEQSLPHSPPVSTPKSPLTVLPPPPPILQAPLSKGSREDLATWPFNQSTWTPANTASSELPMPPPPPPDSDASSVSSDEVPAEQQKPPSNLTDQPEPVEALDDANPQKLVKRVIGFPFVICLVVARFVIEVILVFLDAPLFGGWRAKDVSTAAGQLYGHLHGFAIWPWAWKAIGSGGPVGDEPITRAQYLSFYNDVIVSLLNWVVGVFVFAFLWMASSGILNATHSGAGFITADVLRGQIYWLMGWPAGFKLNEPLDEFLGNLFLLLIDVWDVFTTALAPFEVFFIRFIAFTGLFGLSMVFAMTSDMVSIVTFHVYSFYEVSSLLYRVSLQTMLSLFHLFRGKKRNVLRHRVDSAAYDLDQLLLGTIMFTVVVLLFPTITAYYVFLSLTRILVLAIQFALNGGRLVTNHFPLFYLILFVTDRHLLPAGVTIDVLSSTLPAPPAHYNGSRLFRPLRALGRTLLALSVKEETPRMLTKKRRGSVSSSIGILTPDMDGEETFAHAVSMTTTHFSLRNNSLGIGSLFHRYQTIVSALLKDNSPNNLLSAALLGKGVRRRRRLVPQPFGDSRASIQEFSQFAFKAYVDWIDRSGWL